MDLSFTSSVVQERMMRVGIEARGVTDLMEIYEIAVKTLKDDRIRFKGKVSTNMQELFANQLKFGGPFYFLLVGPCGNLQVIRTSDLSELDGKYEGELSSCGAIPRLRRKGEQGQRNTKYSSNRMCRSESDG